MGTARIYANQSAWIDKYNPDQNNCAGEDLLCGRAGDGKFALIKFDVSPIRGKKIIYPCTISFFRGAVAYEQLAAYKCVKDWDEKTVTYTNRPIIWEGYVAVPGQTPNSWVTILKDDVNHNLIGYEALSKYGICITGGNNENPQIIKSSRHANRPYADVSYIDVTPGVSNLSPNSGFVNRKTDNRFSWQFSYDPTGVCGILKQGGAKLEWRQFGSSTIHAIDFTGEQWNAVVPANTFPSGEIEWRVTVKSDSNVWSSPSSWCKFSTADVLSTATALTPTGETLNATQPITFTWTHSTTTGTAQQAFDIQIKLDGVWYDLVSRQAGSESRYTAPQFALPSGALTWRVRTYNTDNVAGAWSNELSFTSFGVLNKPIIGNITTTARPTISWRGTEQQLWEMQILSGDNTVYQTGYMTGLGVNSFKIPSYLEEDGSYSVKMRIRDVFGVWSGWAEKQFTIATTKPQKPAISIGTEQFGIKLSAPSGCLIYRREVRGEWFRIGEAENNSFIDYSAASGVTYEYKARKTDQSNDSFCDSDVVSGCVSLRYSVLTLGNENLELKLRVGGGSGRSCNTSTEKILTQFTGCMYPKVEQSGFKEKSISMSYFIPNEELTLLLKMADAEVILYRSPSGVKFWGTIGELSCNELYLGFDVSFDIRQVDYMEGLRW